LKGPASRGDRDTQLGRHLTPRLAGAAQFLDPIPAKDQLRPSEWLSGFGPFLLGRFTPETIRSLIIARSNSANAAMICTMNFAIGLDSSVPMFWVTAKNATPMPASSWSVAMVSTIDRPHRSSFQVRTSSKRRRRASFINRFRSGLDDFVPEIPVSTYSSTI
jgi:hypothetical protein